LERHRAKDNFVLPKLASGAAVFRRLRLITAAMVAGQLLAEAAHADAVSAIPACPLRRHALP